MTEEENICDRTYRAHERVESKPDKSLTSSLPRHSKQDHKVRTIQLFTEVKVHCMWMWVLGIGCQSEGTIEGGCKLEETMLKKKLVLTTDLNNIGILPISKI